MTIFVPGFRLGIIDPAEAGTSRAVRLPAAQILDRTPNRT